MSVVCLSDSLTRRHVALVILLFSTSPTRPPHHKKSYVDDSTLLTSYYYTTYLTMHHTRIHPTTVLSITHYPPQLCAHKGTSHYTLAEWVWSEKTSPLQLFKERNASKFHGWLSEPNQRFFQHHSQKGNSNQIHSQPSILSGSRSNGNMQGNNKFNGV